MGMFLFSLSLSKAFPSKIAFSDEKQEVGMHERLACLKQSHSVQVRLQAVKEEIVVFRIDNGFISS